MTFRIIPLLPVGRVLTPRGNGWIHDDCGEWCHQAHAVIAIAESMGAKRLPNSATETVSRIPLVGHAAPCAVLEARGVLYGVWRVFGGGR